MKFSKKGLRGFCGSEEKLLNCHQIFGGFLFGFEFSCLAINQF